jgi:hypothetical protein
LPSTGAAWQAVHSRLAKGPWETSGRRFGEFEACGSWQLEHLDVAKS